MKRFFALFILLICLFVPACQAQKTLRVVEWNVENVFDTLHDAGHNDYDFLPEGNHHWTASRYWRKLDDIGKTIMAIGDSAGMPALVGLCEVENDSVLTHLTQRSVLRYSGYRYIMTNSPDRRGVDVALLYHPGMFRLLKQKSIRIPSESNNFTPTRDILYASGKLSTGDTLHVFVCHLPSKTGGVKKSNRHRNLAVQILRTHIDSILYLSPCAQILVMGDFNATYSEKIFRQLCPPLNETLPTSRKALNRPVGTYFYQGLWSYLDHILVSSSVQYQNGAHESRLPHLLDKEGHPKRIFKGTFYNGGISDHLPLVLDLMVADQP